MSKEFDEIKELKKIKREIKNSYLEEKQYLKNKISKDLIELKEDYTLEKINIKNPLKAKKYQKKVERKRLNRVKNEAPYRKTLEEIGNATTHGIGALIGVAFLIFMILKSSTTISLLASIIYGSCFILQMLFSCLYHCFRCGSTVKRIFRRFDYSSIYLQIGGTFAPLFLLYMNSDKMWGMPYGIIFFICQWALIILGITFVGVFGPGRIRWLHFTLYFLLGWSGLLFIPYWIKYDISLLIFILSGGIVYTLGMIPFALFKDKAPAHFIWHFFVLIGAILQWIGIFLYVI